MSITVCSPSPQAGHVPVANSPPCMALHSTPSGLPSRWSRDRARRPLHGRLAMRRWPHDSNRARSCSPPIMRTTSWKRSCCSGCAVAGCARLRAWHRSGASAHRHGTRGHCSNSRATNWRPGPCSRICAGRTTRRTSIDVSTAITCASKSCPRCASAGLPSPRRQDALPTSPATRSQRRQPASRRTSRVSWQARRWNSTRCWRCPSRGNVPCCAHGSPGWGCRPRRHVPWLPCGATWSLQPRTGCPRRAGPAPSSDAIAVACTPKRRTMSSRTRAAGGRPG